MIRLTSLFAVCVIAVAAWAQENKPKEPSEPKTTVECLQAAYVGESNASARYTEFARKADEEGYAGVASLFRAAAKAEKFHADNHAAALKKLGATPQADLQKPDVKSTRENIAAAIHGESYERDTMYPAFLKIAQADRNKDAVQAFNFARSAEAEHATLYQDALDHLADWKTGKKDFFVCPVCGKTVLKIDFAKCPVCFTDKDKYEKVS